jgi:ABC-2 type transport system ATP-binding protein
MAQIRGLNAQAVNKAAQIANIENVMRQKIDTLSKGYQRRVGFAQSILSNPPVLLLDEPTDGLDPNQKDYMRSLIKSMSADKTILISTHLLEEAQTVCNRIILLDNGTIKADATLDEILKNTGCKNIAEAFRTLTDKEKTK